MPIPTVRPTPRAGAGGVRAGEVVAGPRAIRRSVATRAVLLFTFTGRSYGPDSSRRAGVVFQRAGLVHLLAGAARGVGDPVRAPHAHAGGDWEPRVSRGGGAHRPPSRPRPRARRRQRTAHAAHRVGRGGGHGVSPGAGVLRLPLAAPLPHDAYRARARAARLPS